MDVKQTKMLKQLLGKLSALRATLNNEERALLDGFVVGSPAADEVIVHGMQPAITPAMTPGMTPAADEVMVHGMQPAITPAVTPGMTPAADEVMVHGMQPAVTPSISARVALRVMFDAATEKYTLR